MISVKLILISSFIKHRNYTHNVVKIGISFQALFMLIIKLGTNTKLPHNTIKNLNTGSKHNVHRTLQISTYTIEKSIFRHASCAHHQTETNTCNKTTKNSENQCSNIITNFGYVVLHQATQHSKNHQKSKAHSKSQNQSQKSCSLLNTKIKYKILTQSHNPIRESTSQSRNYKTFQSQFSENKFHHQTLQIKLEII